MKNTQDAGVALRDARGVLVAAFVAAALAGCGQGDDGKAHAQGGPGGGAPPAMPVTVVEVQPRQVPVTVEAVGTTEGVREVEVRARVGGILERQLYREGEPVKAGAPLFQIERAPFEIALDQAKAALAQQQALVEQARRERDRLQSLLSDKAISQREYDTAASTLQTSDAALQSARAQVREAELNLGYTRVAAPISGIALRAQRSEGSLVSPTTDSGLLTTIAQTNPIRVRFALSESEYAQIRGARGQTVRLVLPDGSLLPTVGKLDYTGSVVDARLGTVGMRAELPNPDGALLPGQFVRAQVAVGNREAFLVPQAAVMNGEQGRFVWTVGPEGKAVPKPVQTGGWQGPDWIVRSGLAAGDKVITNNLMKIRPGAPVQAMAAAPAGAASGAAPSASAAASAASR